MLAATIAQPSRKLLAWTEMGEVSPEKKGRLSRTQPLFSEPVLLPRPSRPSQIFPLALSYREGSVGRESSVPLTLSSLSFWSPGFLCTPHSLAVQPFCLQKPFLYAVNRDNYGGD